MPGKLFAVPRIMSMARMDRAAIFAASTLCLLTSPAEAQDMEIMGKVEATVDGSDVSLWIPYIIDEDEPYAFLSGSGLMAMLSVDAFSGLPGEALDYPRLSLGIMRPGPQAKAIELDLYRVGESDRMYLAEHSAGNYEIGPVSVDGQTISFEFEATAVPTDRTTFEPITDADPIRIDGQVEVTLINDGP